MSAERQGLIGDVVAIRIAKGVGYQADKSSKLINDYFDNQATTTISNIPSDNGSRYGNAIETLRWANKVVGTYEYQGETQTEALGFLEEAKRLEDAISSDVSRGEIVDTDAKANTNRTAFQENLIAYAFGGDELGKAKAVEEMDLVRQDVKGIITRARKTGNYDALKERYGIEIRDVDPKELSKYANQLLASKPMDEASILGMDVDVVYDAPNEKIKKALWSIARGMYRQVDKRIDPKRLVEIEEEMNKSLNFVDGDEKKPRKNTVVFINGGWYEVGKYLNAQEGSTVYPRNNTFNEPTEGKLFRLLTAVDMLKKRSEMDMEGKNNHPIYVYGHAFTSDQLEGFSGVGNIKSVVVGKTGGYDKGLVQEDTRLLNETLRVSSHYISTDKIKDQDIETTIKQTLRL